MTRKILINRVQNTIQAIKHSLSRHNEFDLFNDLLIISRIVPTLPQDTLLDMLRILPPLLDYITQTHTPHSDSLMPLMRVLAKAQVDDLLLSDFLSISGIAITA